MMPALATAPVTAGCRLVSADGRTLPLRAAEIRADARAGLCRVVLEQTFVNPFAEPLQVHYQLPLPADGAVVDFAFTLEGRRIQGVVRKKADARAAFEQAVLEGRTAALLEQERSSLFTQELGNVPPGATLRAEIVVEQPLSWRDGGWEWRWPTVVAPRYLGTSTPDADRVTVDVADAPLPVACRAVLTIADAPHAAPMSPSHTAARRGADVVLDGALDRDVVVRWAVAGPATGVDLEVARPDGADAVGLLTVVPPAATAGMAPVTRDLVLLLDTSGSMGGNPLAQLQRFSAALVTGLRDGDHLEMIEFGSTPVRWRSGSVRVDAGTRADALDWIRRLKARGGTEMRTAIEAALAPLRSEAQRQVVLVTDGLIGFESQIVGHIRRHLPAASRVHTIGVGHGVNRTLTGGAARAGAGVEIVVTPDEDVTPAVAALLARTGDPLVVDLQLAGSALRGRAPERLPDLLAGAPARLSVALDPNGGTLDVIGRTATGEWRKTLVVPPTPIGHGRRVVATRWARERVEDLELAVTTGDDVAACDAQIEATGLRFGIATRLTSWVAEDDRVRVDPGDPIREVTIPHQLPHQMSAEGVGLRSVAMAPPPPPMAAPAPMGMPRGAVFDAAPSFAAGGASAPKLRSKRVREVEEGKVDAATRRFARAERAQAESGRAIDAFDADEVAADAPSEAPRLRIRARVRWARLGVLVVTFELPPNLAWTPDGLVAVRDGVRTAVTAMPGTTKAGASGTIRLVIAWTGDAPATIEAGGYTLELA